MPDNAIVVLLIGVGIVTGLGLLAAAARTRRTPGELDPHGSRAALGMSVGMLLGGILGAIVWLSTGQFVFWVVFLGGGMVSGLAIGSARVERRH